MPNQNNHCNQERFHFLAGTFIAFLTTAFLLISNQIVLFPSLPNWYDQQRFLMLLLLAAALLAFALWPAPRIPKLTPYLMTAAVALSAISPLPGWAFAETALFMGLVVTAYWLSTSLKRLHEYQPVFLIHGLIAYGTLISLAPLMQFATSITSGETDFALSTLFRGFSNHRFFSQTESMLIPLMALPTMLLHPDSRWRKIGNVAACLLWLLAFAAGTRAFYVAMIASAGFAWLFNGQAGQRWVLWQIRFSVVGLVGYTLLFTVLPWLLDLQITTDNARLNQLDSALDSSGRIGLWLASANLIKEHPLIGIGPMHFATLPFESHFAAGSAANPHNSIIQILVEWGLPMGLTLLAICALFFWHMFRSTKDPASDRHSLERSVLCVTWVTSITYSLLDSSIVTPYTQILLTGLAGWTLSLFPETNLKGKQKNTLPPHERNMAMIRLACLASGTYLAWLALIPFNNLNAHVVEYLNDHPAQTLWPRFWSQGLINLPKDSRYTGYLFSPPKSSETP